MKLLYSFQQLRETVSNFCQKELAPYADQIDKENNFLQLRVSSPVTIYLSMWFYDLYFVYTVNSF